jgi:hypothetical protein
MPDWVINIISSDSGEASFIVDSLGAKQGDPLNAKQDDLVSWYNQTNDDHQPWETDSDYNPNELSDLSDIIPGGEPSNNYNCTQPAGSPQQWTVYYYCSRHPDNANERGSINVKALPKNSINITGSGTGTTFLPPVRGATYTANQKDTINWNNLTEEAHQPWPTDATYSKALPVSSWPGTLSGVIQPGDSSLVYAVTPPDATTTNWTVYYFCFLHQDRESERGTIVIPPPSG